MDKKMKMKANIEKRFFSGFFVAMLLSAACVAFASCATARRFSGFGNWNDCASLDALKGYVENVTDRNSPDFIPVKDRIAVFDMDGTLCGELFPEYLEYLLLEHRCLDDENYEASPELKKVAMQIRESGKTYSTPKVSGFDLIHANAQAKAFAGLTPDEFIGYVKDFFKSDAQGFAGLKYSDSIYKPMIDVVNYLIDRRFTVYVVSGSDRMLCRALVCDQLGIPENQVIGMDITLVASNQKGRDGLSYQFNDDGPDVLQRGDSLVIKNLKMNKVQQIAQEIGKQPVL
ncbi:MAG TPA: hypothetical protein DCO86_02570, partial [Spirochaetaceae bacterium]|nr:hypothetical protein [Spirochaetaceae bacterium]